MTTSHKRLPDYKEDEQLIWHRKVLAVTWCVLVGFMIAVVLVIGFLYAVDPYHGDGRDPFMKEVIRAQEINKLTKP